MKKSQRIAGFFCAAGMIASLTTPAFAAEQAAPVKAHAEMADAFIQVEDTFAAFWTGMDAPVPRWPMTTPSTFPCARWASGWAAMWPGTRRARRCA